MRVQFDATQFDYPRKPGCVIYNNFFCGATGGKRKRDRAQPGGALLGRTLLVKRWSFSPVHESFEDDRTIANSSQGARGNRQIVANQIEFRDARLRKINLVRMGDADFTSIN